MATTSPVGALLTVENIARYLGVGINRAYEIAHRIGPVQIGRSLRVRPEDLERWIAAQREIREP